MPGGCGEPDNPYVIENLNIHTGAIAPVASGWLLNPVSTAPITLLEATREVAEAAKRLLEQSYNAPQDAISQLAVLIEAHALTFKELQHTLEAYRVRCFPVFEKLKSESPEYKDAFTEQPVSVPSREMSCEDIRGVFRDCFYSLKQLALETGFTYSAVTSHFGGRRLSAPIQEAAQKIALRLQSAHRREEVVQDLRCRAEELSGVPPTAAEVLPIWEGDPNPVALATQIVDRFRQAGAIDLHRLRMVDPEGAYGTRWKLHGPIDSLTCAECRALMESAFTIKGIPEVPVHPGCRCTILLDISDLENEIRSA